MIHKRTVKIGLIGRDELPYESLCGKEGTILYSWVNVTCPDCIKIGHPVHRFKKENWNNNSEGKPAGLKRSVATRDEKAIYNYAQVDMVKFLAWIKSQKSL